MYPPLTDQSLCDVRVPQCRPIELGGRAMGATSGDDPVTLAGDFVELVAIVREGIEEGPPCVEACRSSLHGPAGGVHESMVVRHECGEAGNVSSVDRIVESNDGLLVAGHATDVPHRPPSGSPPTRSCRASGAAEAVDDLIGQAGVVAHLPCDEVVFDAEPCTGNSRWAEVRRSRRRRARQSGEWYPVVSNGAMAHPSTSGERFSTSQRARKLGSSTSWALTYHLWTTGGVAPGSMELPDR